MPHVKTSGDVVKAPFIHTTCQKPVSITSRVITNGWMGLIGYSSTLQTQIVTLIPAVFSRNILIFISNKFPIWDQSKNANYFLLPRNYIKCQKLLNSCHFILFANVTSFVLRLSGWNPTLNKRGEHVSSFAPYPNPGSVTFCTCNF